MPSFQSCQNNHARLELNFLFGYIAIIVDRQKNRIPLPWIILLLALGIRLWGVNFSLPFIYHVDEERFSQIALNYLRGDLNPHFFHVPSLYTYSLAGLWKLYYYVGHSLKLGDKFLTNKAFIDGFGRDPTVYILLGRGLTVILSVGTILATFFLGKYLAGPWVGTIAALFLIFSPEHNKISHYLAPDAPMVFFLVLSYFFIFKVYETGRLRHYFLSGLWAGLAFTTKYSGHFLVLPLFLAHAFRAQEKKERIWRTLFHPGLFLWAICFLAVFFLGTPFALFDHQTFWRDFRWQSSHLFSLGHFGSSTAQPAWLFYLQHGFAENGGPLFQFFIYAGIIFLLLRRQKKDLILISFPLTLFLLMGAWKTRATRYLLPLAPFFIIMGAIALGQIMSYWKILAGKTRLKSLRLAPISAALLVGIFLFPSAGKVVRFNIALTQEDTRTTAKHWIEANIPAGTRIALESYCPQISRGRYRITYRHALYQADLEWLARRRIDYIIISDIMYARFTRFPKEFPQEAQFYLSLDEKAVLVKTFEPRWNEYLLDLHNPTLKIYRLSRLPDPSFPGNFNSYSQLIRLQKDENNNWHLASSLRADFFAQKEEACQNIYLRAEDAEGKKIFFVYLYEGEIKPGHEITGHANYQLGSLKPGTKIYVGYEVRFLRLPLKENPQAFFPKEIKLAEISSSELAQPYLEYTFYYHRLAGERGEEYAIKIFFSRENATLKMKASVYGGELRWGNDAVLNPWVEIINPETDQKTRINIFSGLLGSAEGATQGPAEYETVLRNISSGFRLAIGYDHYLDGDLPAKAGGPIRILLAPPPNLSP